MLQDIEIENFRCFEKTRISGFTRVNLIGGKNNAGKTALLEALLLEHSPKPRSILQLKEIRRESLEVAKAIPERAWNNFFFNQDKNNIIKIVAKKDEQQEQTIKIYHLNSINSEIFEEYEDPKSLIALISKKQSRISILKIQVISNTHQEYNYSILAGSEGILALIRPDEDDIPFSSSFDRISDIDLTAGYDQARLNEKDAEILKAVQIIDPSIEAIESFLVAEPTLYLKRYNQKRLPLSLFGDAVNRIIELMIKIVNTDYKILLIDEIENGIHYSNQRDFWRTLFRLSIELDTQIFATTHSSEMIQAFKDVGLTEYPDLGAYFEMTRAAKTGKIIGIKRDLETLEYALEQERPIRG